MMSLNDIFEIDEISLEIDLPVVLSHPPVKREDMQVWFQKRTPFIREVRN